MMTQNLLDQMKSLVDAVKSNHNLQGSFITCVNPMDEMRMYMDRTACLTLPHRFGMYKSLKHNAKFDKEMKLDDPNKQADSSSSSLVDNPNHKRRSIF